MSLGQAVEAVRGQLRAMELLARTGMVPSGEEMVGFEQVEWLSTRYERDKPLCSLVQLSLLDLLAASAASGACFSICRQPAQLGARWAVEAAGSQRS